MSGAYPGRTGRTLRSEVHSTRDARRSYADYRARGNVRGRASLTHSSRPADDACFTDDTEMEHDVHGRFPRGFPGNRSRGRGRHAYRSTGARDESEVHCHSTGYATASHSKPSNQVVCSRSNAEVMEVTGDKCRSSHRRVDEKKYNLRRPSTSTTNGSEVLSRSASCAAASASSNKSSNQNPTAEMMEVTVDNQRSSARHAGSSSAVTENEYDLQCTSNQDSGSSSYKPDRQRLADSSKTQIRKLLAESASFFAADMKLKDKEMSCNESKFVKSTQIGGKSMNTGSTSLVRMEVRDDVRKKDESCKKDANQTRQNLTHSVRDQKTPSTTATCSSFGRGKVSAESKPKGSTKRPRRVLERVKTSYGDSRSVVLGDSRNVVPSTHVAAGRRSFTSDSKANRTAKPDDSHRAPADRHADEYRDGRSRRAMPVCNTREFSKSTYHHSSFKNATEKVCATTDVSVHEDWEDDLFELSLSQHNVTPKTDNVSCTVQEAVHVSTSIRPTAGGGSPTFAKEDCAFEDWEDELSVFSSVGRNMTVDTEDVACSVDEHCMEEAVKISSYDSTVVGDDASLTSANNTAETLLAFEDSHNDKQNSALSSEAKTKIDCTLAQLQSEMYDAINENNFAGDKRVVQAVPSPAKETTDKFVSVGYMTDIVIPEYDSQTVNFVVSDVEKFDQETVNILMQSDSEEQYEHQSICEDIEPYEIGAVDFECDNYLPSEEYFDKTFRDEEIFEQQPVTAASLDIFYPPAASVQNQPQADSWQARNDVDLEVESHAVEHASPACVSAPLSTVSKPLFAVDDRNRNVGIVVQKRAAADENQSVCKSQKDTVGDEGSCAPVTHQNGNGLHSDAGAVPRFSLQLPTSHESVSSSRDFSFTSWPPMPVAGTRCRSWVRPEFRPPPAEQLPPMGASQQACAPSYPPPPQHMSTMGNRRPCFRPRMRFSSPPLPPPTIPEHSPAVGNMSCMHMAFSSAPPPAPPLPVTSQPSAAASFQSGRPPLLQTPPGTHPSPEASDWSFLSPPPVLQPPIPQLSPVTSNWSQSSFPRPPPVESEWSFPFTSPPSMPPPGDTSELQPPSTIPQPPPVTANWSSHLPVPRPPPVESEWSFPFTSPPVPRLPPADTWMLHCTSELQPPSPVPRPPPPPVTSEGSVTYPSPADTWVSRTISELPPAPPVSHSPPVTSEWPCLPPPSAQVRAWKSRGAEILQALQRPLTQPSPPNQSGQSQSDSQQTGGNGSDFDRGFQTSVSAQVKNVTPHHGDRDGRNVATAKALFETSGLSNASEDDGVPASWEDIEDSDFSDIKLAAAASSDCCSDTTADDDWFSTKPGQRGARKWSMTFHKHGSTPPVQSTDWVSHTAKSFSASPRSKNAAQKRRKHSLNLYRPDTDDKDDEDNDWSQKFRTRYEGISTQYIDSHCHLDFLFKRSGFSGSFAKYRNIVSDTYPASFAGCVSVFCNPKMWAYESDGSIFQTVLKDDLVWAAVGCHPKNAGDFNDLAEYKMRQMLKHRRIVALGEIGLDYSGTFYEESERQKEVLRKQTAIAKELNLPLVIHSRDAEHDIIEELGKLVPRNYRIHRHCFTGNWREGQRWLSEFPSSFMGVTPLVTQRNARAASLRDFVTHVPLDKLLLETDSPYFIPNEIPYGKIQYSHPGLAITVARTVAELRGIDVEEVLAACYANTRQMYSI